MILTALLIQVAFTLDTRVHVGSHLAERRVTMLGGRSPHDAGPGVWDSQKLYHAITILA
jgi:hypothetical protein